MKRCILRKKVVLSVLLVCVVMSGLLAFAQEQKEAQLFKVTKYYVYTVEDLNNVRNDLSGTYYLMNDIDLAGYDWEPIGNSYSTGFKGIFDGQGYRIKNVYVNNAADNQGLFGYNKGTIKNLGVVSSYIGGEYSVGMVGCNTGTVGNCYYSGIVLGKEYVGGIVGENSEGSVLECHNDGKVTGTSYVGGVVGLHSSGSVNICYNTGKITGSDQYTGGVVGFNSYGRMNHCYNTGHVIGLGKYAGGIAGASRSGSITYCYNIGDVEGIEEIGGITGSHTYQTIGYCYNTGNITGTGSYVGGIAGRCANDTISCCYNTGKITISGDGKYVAGISGYIYDGQLGHCYNVGVIVGEYYDRATVGDCWDSSGISNCYYNADFGITDSLAIGLTTIQMKEAVSYTGFDFDIVWEIKPTVNDGYPYLKEIPHVGKPSISVHAVKAEIDTYTCSFQMNSGVSLSGTFTVGLYDNDNRLVGCKVLAMENADTSFSAENIPIAASGNATTYKILFCDNESLKPLCVYANGNVTT